VLSFVAPHDVARLLSGVGQLAVQPVTTRDLPVIIGTVPIASASVPSTSPTASSTRACECTERSEGFRARGVLA